MSTAERSLLDTIAAGVLDEHLDALAAAVQARRALLHTVRSVTALANLCVGDPVRIGEQVSPRYLIGCTARSSGSTARARRSGSSIPSGASRTGASAARR